MADRSAIEWTEVTWNPVTGCHQISPGCAQQIAAVDEARDEEAGFPIRRLFVTSDLN